MPTRKDDEDTPFCKIRLVAVSNVTAIIKGILLPAVTIVVTLNHLAKYDLHSSTSLFLLSITSLPLHTYNHPIIYK